MAPRWRKAIGDVASRPWRSALAVVAMAIGLGALSTLAIKQSILHPVIETMQGATDPASARFVVDAQDDSLVQALRNVPGVGAVEARPLIVARVRVGSGAEQEWLPLLLYVVRDFDAQRINLFEPDSGAWPPSDSQILLERSGVDLAGVEPAAQLTVRVPGGQERQLEFAGTVHAQGLAPAWMEHVVYGFVSWTSVVRPGADHESQQLLMRVAEHDLEKGHIQEVADRVQSVMEARGVTVKRVVIPEPGRHVHAAQMNTFLYLVGAFGVLAFVLGSVLVATMIHSLQSEQVRQVGIMKAIGATSRQIAGVYLAEIGLLAALALCLGVPAGWIAGTAYARFSASILNADVSAAPFPLVTVIAVSIVGVVVPLLAGLIPLWRASRISVREALADAPTSTDFATRRVSRVLLRLPRLSRPLALTLRTTFLRPGRLSLTVTMLALGGAMFLSSRNVADGWSRAADDNFARRHYDLLVRFASPHSVTLLDSVLIALPSVKHIEHWPSCRPYLIGPTGAAGEPITLLGMEPVSRLLEPKLRSGGWISDEAPHGAVINHAISAMHPTLAVGDSVALRYDGRTLRFAVVGTVKDLLAQPIVYVPVQGLVQATGIDAGLSETARVVAVDRSHAGQLAAARQVEAAFEGSGIEIRNVLRMEHMKGSLLDHLVIIDVILTLAAALVVLVGGLGLVSTLSINVVQRTREIGVMGAIGARPRVLATHIWLEALLIALMSWVVALVLAAPISYALEAITGRMFFRAPLDFTLSAQAALLWLALVTVLATVASIQPALRAARLPVREAITHV